ncbi:MAG: TauD/TfdA family dioxygenase [Caulobacter sp.]|jgi:taurine dioxygenase|nr:TauD/TfdA family dioxygenase [Caulobacter sp.]
MTHLVRNLTLGRLTVTPLTPTIGAEIDGLDLSQPIEAGEVSAVRQALLDWKVLFFRNQPIDTDEHLSFARNFGGLEVHPFAPQKEGYPEVLAITHNRESRGKENVWHSDVTWRAEPSLGSILRAIELPPVGGDTLFADMYAAYDGLTDEVKEQVDQAVAVHDFAHFRVSMRKRGLTPEQIEAFNQTYPMVEHPVIRTHPETGKRAIYVNAGFTQHIVGMDKPESERLLAHLYAQAAIPEYQCRFRWEPGSIAFWDNRASQHYAASDYWPAVRRMERVTIVGDRPR